MSNGLTPMGRKVKNQELVKYFVTDFKNTIKSNKKANSSYFGVLTVLNDTLAFKSSVMLFISEHEAVEYRDKWIASGKGYARLLPPKY